jgi:hypothetical protein
MAIKTTRGLARVIHDRSVYGLRMRKVRVNDAYDVFELCSSSGFPICSFMADSLFDGEGNYFEDTMLVTATR